MQCSRCQAQNRDGRRFCAQCGAALALACPACGFSNEPSEAFCGGCGTGLTAEPSPPASASAGAEQAERRPLTVMFCDLAESTALSLRLDPEEMSDVLRFYRQCCVDVIRRFRGLVAKYMGDGILIYFGYPQAQEDDAERAVLAALAITREMPLLRPQADLVLHVRIGIATGLVVVGELIGEGTAQEQAVVGQTPNLAARLQSQAEPDTIIISAATHDLTGRLFECRDLGLRHLKGFGEPIRAWQVEREGQVASRFEALRGAGMKLVGRVEEIDRLLNRWSRAKDGEGSVVLLRGEAGIGKSRLAESLLERLGAAPHIVLRYFCSPHHRDQALYPAIAQVEHAAGFRHDDTAAQKLDKLEILLTRLTGNLAETMPIAANLLSIPTGNRYPALALTPQKHKEKALRTILAQIEALAARRPVLILVEDLHWSDPATREWLDLLVEQIAAWRVMVVMTSRPEWVPSWVGAPHVTLLHLSRLPPAQRAEMLLQVTGGKALPPEIAARIDDRTDGIPLFIEELTKAVMESGLLEESDDRYALRGPVPPMAIPTSLHASLLARLDRLASSREVVQIAAALGRGFSYELINAVAALPQQQLTGALDELVRADLIHRRGNPPDAQYSFKHALVRDAADSMMLRGQRRKLHARISATLQTHFPALAAAQPALLAHHAAQAGLVEQAVTQWLKAGQQALARSAMAEAQAQLEKGLAELAGLPDGAPRRQHELALRMALVAALRFTKGYSAPEVGRTLVRARALAEQLGRPDALVSLSTSQWQFHLQRAELRQALALAEQIEAIGTARRDAAVYWDGCRMRGRTRLCLGDFSEAVALLEQCRASVESAPSPREPTEFHAGLLVNLAVTLTYLGSLDQARARLNEALAEARRLDHAPTLAQVLSFANWIAYAAGLPEMGGYAEELQALSAEHGFPFYTGWATTYRGWTATLGGQAPEALPMIRQGLAAIGGAGSVIMLPVALMMLAETHAALGQTSEGLECLAEAKHLIETTGQRCFEAKLRQALGDVLKVAGRLEEAEQEYRQALDLARMQQAKLLELQGSISLARLWNDQGKGEQVQELLAPICSWFTEGFDLPDLAAAKAMLGR